MSSWGWNYTNLWESCCKSNQSCCLDTVCRLYSLLLHPKGCFCRVCCGFFFKPPPHSTPIPLFSCFLSNSNLHKFLLKNELACAAVFRLSPIVKEQLLKKKKNPAASWAWLRPGRYWRWTDLSLQSRFGSNLSKAAWRRSGLQSLQLCLQTPHTPTPICIWYDVHSGNVFQIWGKSWLRALHILFSFHHGVFFFFFCLISFKTWKKEKLIRKQLFWLLTAVLMYALIGRDKWINSPSWNYWPRNKTHPVIGK